MIKEQTSYGDQTCRIHPHFPQRAQPDPGAAGRSTGCHRGCRLQMGSRSFPNKRILRNNLCLPACRVLMYKKMTLEI